MLCKCGSIWRKWDFHVHTPYSLLNNGFGFNPFEETDEKYFDEYVKNLFTKAIDNNVHAIGITDYFMIEGYKRIREKYLMCSQKMEECFPDEKIREKIKEIYIFPNIEFRIQCFVGNTSSPVNYHIIFSDKVPIVDIEDNFLHQIRFSLDVNSSMADKRSLTLHNIEEAGKSVKENNPTERGSELLLGLKKISVNHEEILDVLKGKKIFEGKYFIVIPVDEDLSDISWDGRDYLTRKNLYKQSNCYFSANKKTYAWALAEGEEADRIKEFGSLKPCIWGSDAHDYDKMFKPDGNKFCWIKSDLTFEGLLQILYEPKARVSIQERIPDCETLDSHQIIQSVKFHDKNFQNEEILFNDCLTCIIGGKSTGKSLLLRQVARSIDSQYVEQQEESLSRQESSLQVTPPIVTWKDGTTDARKIVYIPQSYLNRLVDNPEHPTGIDTIIEDVLKEEEAISVAFETLQKQLSEKKKSVREKISEVQELHQKLAKLTNEMMEFGLPNTFEISITALEEQREELAKQIDVKKEDMKKYETLTKKINDLEVTYKQCDSQIEEISIIPKPSIRFSDSCIFDGNACTVHELLNCFPDLQDEIMQRMTSILQDMQSQWNESLNQWIQKLESKKNIIEESLSKEKANWVPLKSKIEKNSQMQEIVKHIGIEKKKLQEAKLYAQKKEKIERAISECKTQIIKSQTDYQSFYLSYCDTINQTGLSKTTDLSFEAQTIWKREEFIKSITNMFNNRNFSSFKEKYNYDLVDLKDEDYKADFLRDLWSAMENIDGEGKLPLKGSYKPESALQMLFDDWYNIHYIVKSGNDTIKEMSPGKKALVLLELLIGLESSKCPILIDQPEDDLDNRSIYSELVQYLRKKKHERQIIIVTHNANVVLGADAEEVIIANQNSDNSPNAEFRFEYRSGSIENDEKCCGDNGKVLKGILNQSGIQQQICDILEGGRTAFELRQKKYTSIDTH